MNQSDAPAFFQLLDTTYDLIGVGPAKIISPAAKAMFFTDLQMYPLHLIEAALSAHRVDPERGRFTPKPADIASQIERRRAVQWLGADEAWAQVPKIEGQPGIMNDVTAQALAVATPLLLEGDDTAARMAFKSTYNRLVERAKLEKRAPAYFVSPGGTYEEHQAVIAEAARQGLIPHRTVVAAPLLAPSKRTPGAKPDLKALMLSLTPKTIPPPERQDYE
jgi:hypothetical protein